MTSGQLGSGVYQVAWECPEIDGDAEKHLVEGFERVLLHCWVDTRAKPEKRLAAFVVSVYLKPFWSEVVVETIRRDELAPEVEPPGDEEDLHATRVHLNPLSGCERAGEEEGEGNEVGQLEEDKHASTFSQGEEVLLRVKL